MQTNIVNYYSQSYTEYMKNNKIFSIKLRDKKIFYLAIEMTNYEETIVSVYNNAYFYEKKYL
jgi:hypothetical protein